MPDVSHLEFASGTYDIKDAQARQSITEMETEINNFKEETNEEIDQFKNDVATQLEYQANADRIMLEDAKLDSYPIIMQSAVTPDGRFSLQSSTCLKSGSYITSGRTSYLATVTTLNDTSNEICIYQRGTGASENKWSLLDRYVLTGNNSVGHGNGCAWKNINELIIVSANAPTQANGKLFVYNYQTHSVSAITVGDFPNIPTGVGYDSTNDTLYVAYGSTVKGYKYGNWTTPTQTITMIDPVGATGQDIETENGILYKVRSDINYGGVSASPLKNSGFIQCYNYGGKMVGTLYIEEINECETIAIDHGYYYLGFNGVGDGLRQSKMNAVSEGLLDTSKYNPYRMCCSSLVTPNSSNFKTIDLYIAMSQPSNVFQYGAGLGSKENPFTSFLAASMAIKKIDQNSTSSINVHIADMGIKSAYDRTLSLIGLNSVIHIISDNPETNNLGCLMIKNCKQVDVNAIWIAPGASYSSDNNFITAGGTKGAVQVTTSTVSFSGLRCSGNNTVDCFTCQTSNVSFEATPCRFTNGRTYITRSQITNLATQSFESSSLTATHNVGEELQ